MPKVIINDTEYEGQPGERLIDVARRNGAHVGFLCDGAGICQICACQVLKGNESLSPPSKAEQNWLPQSWLDEGQRLACQTTLQGTGTVQMVSRAEKMRRQFSEVFYPPEGTVPIQNLGELLDYVSTLIANQITRFPQNAAGAVSLLQEVRPTPQTIQKVFQDAVKVVQTMLGSRDEQSALEQAKK